MKNSILNNILEFLKFILVLLFFVSGVIILLAEMEGEFNLWLFIFVKLLALLLLWCGTKFYRMFALV